MLDKPMMSIIAIRPLKTITLMSYILPHTVLTPKGSIKDLEILFDGGENSWSLAKMKWDNHPVIAMRWNGGSGNGIPSIGNPQSRGYPTWFVVPDEVGEAIKKIVEFSERTNPKKPTA